jgi:membrane associated rhomboid family serine protease
LRVAAYAGQTELLKELSSDGHLVVPSPVFDYLQGIARQAAGDSLAARPFLERAQDHPALANQALKRLRRPLPGLKPHELAPASKAALQELEQRAAWERANLPSTQRRPLAAWALGTCFVLVYLVGLRGGATDHNNLVNMGALIIPQHLAPGAWRLLTAGFVHFGATHLIMNVLGLVFLGGVVERLWGRLPLLVCFLTGSFGAYFLATLVMTGSPSEPKVLLGASAGVFGLVGGLLSFEILGGLYGRINLFSRRLLILSLLVFAQLVFDWFTPIVSSFLHLSGVGCGAVGALPFAVQQWRPKRKRAPASRLRTSRRRSS